MLLKILKDIIYNTKVIYKDISVIHIQGGKTLSTALIITERFKGHPTAFKYADDSFNNLPVILVEADIVKNNCHYLTCVINDVPYLYSILTDDKIDMEHYDIKLDDKGLLSGINFKYKNSNIILEYRFIHYDKSKYILRNYPVIDRSRLVYDLRVKLNLEDRGSLDNFYLASNCVNKEHYDYFMYVYIDGSKLWLQIGDEFSQAQSKYSIGISDLVTTAEYDAIPKRKVTGDTIRFNKQYNYAIEYLFPILKMNADLNLMYKESELLITKKTKYVTYNYIVPAWTK